MLLRNNFPTGDKTFLTQIFGKVRLESPWFKIFPNGFIPLVNVPEMPKAGRPFHLDHKNSSITQDQVIEAAKLISKRTGKKPMDLLWDLAGGELFPVEREAIEGITKLCIVTKKKEAN